ISGFITKPSTLQSADTSSPSGSSRGRAASGARSTSDRQFIYVNGRPCELPRVARLVTDVWRRCSKEALAVSNDGLQMPASNASTAFPFFVLMLQMPTAATIDLTDQRSTPLCASRKTPPKSANSVAGLGESFEIVDLLPTTETLSRQQASVHFSMSDLRAAWSTLEINHPIPVTQVANQHPLDDIDLVSNGEFSLGSFRSTESETAESELSTYFEPQALELSVAQEQLLLNNLDVFAKNGFAFRVDENAPCGRQVQLVATPMLEDHIFGRS
ncbi:hypothetical protein X801_07872, partial [Opisthorchis viverrini]